jgi:hypothetical protein
MRRPGDWGRRQLPELLVVGLLLAFGVLLTLPYSGPDVDWSPDGLYYEAQKREVEGTSAEEARAAVFASDIAAPLKQGERSLAVSQRRIDNPQWVEYSSRFYRRRWTVPAMAAAVDPLFGIRALEEVSLIGLVLLPPLLYLLLRRRFTQELSLGASVFCALLPPLLQTADGPVTDSWGLTLLVAGLLGILLVRDSGMRWYPVLIVIVLALSFTRDLTIVLIVAAGWLAVSDRLHGIRDRSRRMAAAAAGAVLASLAAPLLYSASVRENLAYVFNDYRIPSDTGWSSIVSDYPSQLSNLVVHDLKYPVHSQYPVLLTLVMGLVVLAGLVVLFRPWAHDDPFLSLIRAAAAGGLVTILISVNYTDLRLELVFVPAIAAGLALLGERLVLRTPPPRAADASAPL